MAGKPLTGERKARSFWSKVNISDGCWEWKATIGHNGYGKVSHFGKVHSAHRVAWEIVFGVIPPGMCVLHKCDNRRCVNPHHLFLGTQSDNLKDMKEKNRSCDERGSSNPSAKLTNEDIETIMSLRKDKHKTYKEIAETLGVSQATVRDIAIGESWNNIKRERCPIIRRKINANSEINRV